MNTDPYSNQNNPYGQAQNRGSQNPAQTAMNAISMAGMARTNNVNRDNQMLHNQNYMPNLEKGSGDLYQSSRNSFIKKVYTILSLQLLITVVICFIAVKSQTFKTIFGNSISLILLSVSLIAFSCIIACCTQGMRKYGLPILIIFTILFSLFVGVVCAFTKPEIVLAAAGITAVVVIGLTIFACVTKTDLTGCGPYLLVFCLVMFIFGIVAIFWKSPIVQLIYAGLSALLFSVYLVFDTQLVLGKFQNSYSIDDAYMAAIQLYIDIIQIFLQILKILSYANNN